MSIIVKRQKKKDRGYNFKIMNRDVDDPLYHDPNVPNQVLVHAPTKSEMVAFKKNKNREVPEYLRTIDESYEVSGFDQDKDTVDYRYDEFQRKYGEGAEAEGEGDYDFEDYDYEEEGDDDYEFMGFNNKVDKKFKEEMKQNYNFKPAEGVNFVQYDAYGLPRTEEIARLKQEMNLKDSDVLGDESAQVLYIKPPEEYKMYGHHKNVDVERKDMDDEMKEVFDVMEEVDGEVQDTDNIDDDFLGMLNENQPALVEKEFEDMEECKTFDEFGDLQDGEEEALAKARAEADDFMKNMPNGLNEEMQLRLAGAREHLANQKAEKEKLKKPVEGQEEIDEGFEDILDEYNEEGIGAVMDDMMDPMEDLIDQDAFDEIMQEFIEDNRDTCKKLYSQYHDDEFASKIQIEGENIEEIVEKDEKMKEKVYKMLKQKNGNIVKLVPKEEMQRFYEKMNAEELDAKKETLKKNILKFNKEILEREAREAELAMAEIDEGEGEGEETQESKRWDVDTILTTKTNTDNHPGLIKSVVKVNKHKIKLDPKTKAPEIEVEYVDTYDKKKSKPAPFIEEILSEEESDEEFDMDNEELKAMEGMSEKEKKKYLRKLNKKQVKKERKERRKQKKAMKKEFSRHNQKFAKINTVGVGEIRPGVSVRRI